MFSRHALAIAFVLSAFTAPQAFAWTQLAQCGSLNQLDRATVYTDGAGIIVQLMSKGGDVEAEFKTVHGDEVAGFDPSDAMDAASAGSPRAYVVKKESSSAVGDSLTDAALLSLVAHTKPSHRINSFLALNGKVVSLYCNQPLGD